MCVCVACMYGCVPHAWCPWRQEKGMDSEEMELKVVVGMLHVAGSNQTFPVILTAESSLQPQVKSNSSLILLHCFQAGPGDQCLGQIQLPLSV